MSIPWFGRIFHAHSISEINHARLYRKMMAYIQSTYFYKNLKFWWIIRTRIQYLHVKRWWVAKVWAPGDGNTMVLWRSEKLKKSIKSIIIYIYYRIFQFFQFLIKPSYFHPRELILRLHTTVWRVDIGSEFGLYS